MTKSSTSCDRAGHAKAGVHNSATPRCVVTEEAKCARQTRPRTRNKPGQARAIGEFWRNRPRKEILCCDRIFPCRDRDMCRLWKLGRDTKILGHDRV